MKNKEVYNLADIGMVIHNEKVDFYDKKEVVFTSSNKDIAKSTYEFYKWLEEEFTGLTYNEKLILKFLNPECYIWHDIDGFACISVDEPEYHEDYYSALGDYDILDYPFEGVKECTQVKKLLNR